MRDDHTRQGEVVGLGNCKGARHLAESQVWVFARCVLQYEGPLSIFLVM